MVGDSATSNKFETIEAPVTNRTKSLETQAHLHTTLNKSRDERTVTTTPSDTTCNGRGSLETVNGLSIKGHMHCIIFSDTRHFTRIEIIYGRRLQDFEEVRNPKGARNESYLVA